MVLGDLNDGPGLDEFEDLFGRSSVEIIMGTGNEARLYDPHARMALGQRLGAQPTSARFFLSRQKRYLQALLDYVFVSDGLRGVAQEWRIWHPFEDHRCYEEPALREALLTASDHFPVVLDIDI
jgi:endonuclease/exonuclease/phosphatase family metal-dependent hydrolase